MAFDFSEFKNKAHEDADRILDEQYVDWLVNEQSLDMILHYKKLWDYYRNEMREINPNGSQNSESARPYCQLQEYGLPSRITGVNHSFYGGISAGLTCPLFMYQLL